MWRSWQAYRRCGGFAELGGNGSCVPEHEQVLSRSGQRHPTGVRLLNRCRERARITRHARSFSDHAMFIIPGRARYVGFVSATAETTWHHAGSEGWQARKASSQASQQRPQCVAQCRRLSGGHLKLARNPRAAARPRRAAMAGPSPFPGQIGNQPEGNGNWGFPGLGWPRNLMITASHAPESATASAARPVDSETQWGPV